MNHENQMPTANTPRAAIPIIVLSISPNSYEGKAYEQYALVQSEGVEWSIFDNHVLLKPEHIGKITAHLLALLGRIEKQAGSLKKLSPREHQILTLYGQISNLVIKPDFDRADPFISLSMILDVGVGTFECVIRHRCKRPEDYSLQNLRNGDYIVYYPGRVDLKAIVENHGRFPSL